MGWQPRPPTTRPRYLDLVDQIREAIRTGRLQPGDRLPTHRALAREAGVTVSTATEAYREATRRHLVAGEVGRGTFVLADSAEVDLFAATAGRPRPPTAAGGPGPALAIAPAAADEPGPDVVEPVEGVGTVDLSANTPATDPASDRLAATLAEVAGGVGEGYPTAVTLLRGRLAMERVLRSAGLDHPADRIHLTAGAQQALLVALLSTAGPGSVVLAERLTFPGLVAVARVLRLRLVPVDLDERGLVPDDLDRQAARSGSSVLVTVPVLQNPTGATMDDARRRAVAEVARHRRLTVIEDDVYRGLTDHPALASVLPERTLVVSGLSKTVEPALRLGALSGPADLMGPIRAETHLHGWLVNPVAVAVLDRWVEDGTVAARTGWQRAEVERRWRLAGTVLGPSPLTPAPHRFLPLTRSATTASDDLAAEGILVSPSTHHGVGARPPKGIRVSLTAAPGRATLHRALVRLDRVLGARRVR